MYEIHECEMRDNPSVIHLSPTDPTIKKIAAVVGYNGRKFRAEIGESVRVWQDYDDAGYSRYYIVNLLNVDQFPRVPRSMIVKDIDFGRVAMAGGRDVPIPEDGAVVVHSSFQGRDLGLTIHIRAKNAAHLLPAPVPLTADEYDVLSMTNSMVASMRPSQSPFWIAASRTLREKGLLDGRGAITVDGRNALANAKERKEKGEAFVPAAMPDERIKIVHNASLHVKSGFDYASGQHKAPVELMKEARNLIDSGVLELRSGVSTKPDKLFYALGIMQQVDNPTATARMLEHLKVELVKYPDLVDIVEKTAIGRGAKYATAQRVAMEREKIARDRAAPPPAAPPPAAPPPAAPPPAARPSSMTMEAEEEARKRRLAEINRQFVAQGAVNIPPPPAPPPPAPVPERSVLEVMADRPRSAAAQEAKLADGTTVKYLGGLNADDVVRKVEDDHHDYEYDGFELSMGDYYEEGTPKYPVGSIIKARPKGAFADDAPLADYIVTVTGVPAWRDGEQEEDVGVYIRPMEAPKNQIGERRAVSDLGSPGVTREEFGRQVDEQMKKVKLQALEKRAASGEMGDEELAHAYERYSKEEGEKARRAGPQALALHMAVEEQAAKDRFIGWRAEQPQKPSSTLELQHPAVPMRGTIRQELQMAKMIDEPGATPVVLSKIEMHDGQTRQVLVDGMMKYAASDKYTWEVYTSDKGFYRGTVMSKNAKHPKELRLALGDYGNMVGLKYLYLKLTTKTNREMDLPTY